MLDVRITLDRDRAVLVAPYNPNLPARARQLGGRPDKSTGEFRWEFPQHTLDRVQALARSFYGCDGTEDPEDRVTVHVDLGDTQEMSANYCLFAGRQIAIRWRKRDPVRLADGVTVVEGVIPAFAGSEKNPRVLDYGDGPVLIEIAGLPAAALGIGGLPPYTIAERTRTGPPSLEYLRAERERLLARVAEIERALAAAPTGPAELPAGARTGAVGSEAPAR